MKILKVTRDLYHMLMKIMVKKGNYSTQTWIRQNQKTTSPMCDTLP